MPRTRWQATRAAAKRGRAARRDLRESSRAADHLLSNHSAVGLATFFIRPHAPLRLAGSSAWRAGIASHFQQRRENVVQAAERVDYAATRDVPRPCGDHGRVRP
jgi:hypothetical protein